MIQNDIKFEKLTYLTKYYDDPVNGLPEKSGIYFWVYWPEFDPYKIDIDRLEEKLIEFSGKKLQFEEELHGRFKYKSVIYEQRFENNGNPFGLSPSKRIKLINYLSDKNNLESFSIFFKEVCFARPFYIGKANNLRTRLVAGHFKRKTEVIPEIEKQKIPLSEIWIGYKLIPPFENEDMNTIFEEILSRNIKPGLTKKPN